MTPKQQRFVDEYLVDLNASQAAIRAGYAPKNADVQGPRLLVNDGIKAKVAEGLQKRAEKLEIDAEWVLARLVSNNAGALALEKPDYGSSNKALELIGRHLAMFTDKQVVDATVAQKTPRAEVPEPKNYAEWLQARMAGTFGSTGGNGSNGHGNGNRVAEELEK